MWKVRFAPNETGTWRYSVTSTPSETGLQQVGQVRLLAPAPDVHGFLRTTPKQEWDFRYEDATSVFLLGDTVYNLSGAAASGQDCETMLLRRKVRGFNLFRARLHMSSFPPPRALEAEQSGNQVPATAPGENGDRPQDWVLYLGDA